MKRDILCMKCGLQPLNEYPREHHTKKLGTALQSFVCDLCLTPLPIGTRVVARSIWVDDHGTPYYPWEQDYISLEKSLKGDPNG